MPGALAAVTDMSFNPVCAECVHCMYKPAIESF